MAVKIPRQQNSGADDNKMEVDLQRSIKLDQIGLNSIQSAIAHVVEKNLDTGKNTIVSICGGSCTGKSTQVASLLKNHFGADAQVLSQDNYMFASVDRPLDPIYQWDHPDFYNVEGSAALMDLLRNGFRASMPEHSTQRKRVEWIDIEPSKIILFEGLYAAFESLPDYADLVIYVEMPLYARIVRRLIRNLYERYRTFHPQEILESFLNSPVRAHGDFVIQQKKHADLVVSSSYSFEDSICRFDLQPIPNYSLRPARKRLFQFLVDDMFSFEVEGGNGEFFFTLLFQNSTYLHFPIHADTYLRLTTLNMMTL